MVLDEILVIKQHIYVEPSGGVPGRTLMKSSPFLRRPQRALRGFKLRGGAPSGSELEVLGATDPLSLLDQLRV